MADWFKFYENDLDETRFQYALHQVSEVCSVWVGILSECCRHKSDTIRWGSNEIELFGFSQRLNVSVPKVNEAIKLLIDIDYISKGENTLKVLKWNTKQSDYCSRIKRRGPNSVRTVSEQCSPRGEESRVDKKKEEVQIKVPDKFSQNKEFLEKWHSWMEVRRAKKGCKNFPKLFQEQINWLADFSVPDAIESLSQSIRNDWQGLFEPKNKVNGNGHKMTTGDLSGIDKMILLDEKKALVARVTTIESQYDGHQCMDPKDFAERKSKKARIEQINILLGTTV